MFRFRRSASDEEHRVSDDVPHQKEDAYSDNRLYQTLLNLVAETEDPKSDAASVTSDESTQASTDVSELSMDSDGDGATKRDQKTTRSTVDSFLNRLDQATNPMTPQDEALDLFNQLHIWAINATKDRGKRGSTAIEIRDEIFLKLLRYIRANLDEKQCVFKAVTLIDCLSCHEDRDPLALVEAEAVNTLVLVLLSHKSHSYYTHDPSSTQKYVYACFVWRTWDILLDIVLAHSFVNYLQRSDEDRRDETQESQRTKLLILVQFLLDVCGESLSALRVRQIFEVLTMLLRVDYGRGRLEPNDDVRAFVWEARIPVQCLRIVTNLDPFDASAKTTNDLRRDQYDDAAGSMVQALTFFWVCLCDSDDDDLSKSIDRWALTQWVRKMRDELPHSGAIHGLCCQILNEIIANRSMADTCASSVRTVAMGTGHQCEKAGRHLLSRCDGPTTTTVTNTCGAWDDTVAISEEGQDTLIDMAGTLLHSSCRCGDEEVETIATFRTRKTS